MTVSTLPDERTALRARQAELLRDLDVLDAGEDAELAAVVRLAAAATETAARALAARIGRILDTPADGGPALRSSTGVALSRRGDTADDLLRRGDAAMYEVKRSRR
ncbi:hypothetical protein [Geodermatophilus sp. URMC 62]|uniref:hypothetical protein n=1 Tax=Geodermatophilus sp. URMC 62 TaxID=3423414 RepID=UPI00406CDE04